MSEGTQQCLAAAMGTGILFGFAGIRAARNRPSPGPQAIPGSHPQSG
jgi:hypothetical protein